jgi:hypothetical protein
MPIQLLPAPTDNLVGLGRRYSLDDRDTRFKLARPEGAEAIETRYWITMGQLDQGATSQCVAYSGQRYLTTNPIRNKPIPDLSELYLDCQRNDEWVGEDYDGTSVRALFKVLTRRGYVKEYRWASDADAVIKHVLLHGPVVVGTVWTMSMFQPDRLGFIYPDGEEVGGHAYVIIGASRKRQAVRMINSWGPNWGQSGRAWITFTHLDKLIKNYGEACAATEIRLA